MVCNLTQYLGFTLYEKSSETETETTFLTCTFIQLNEEVEQMGHDHHKRSFLVRSQEAVTNSNIERERKL